MIDYDKLEEMAQPGWFSGEDMRVLVPEVQKLRPGYTYVEIGVHKGRSLSVVQMIKDPLVSAIGIDVLLQPELEQYMDENKDDSVVFWHTSSVFAARVFSQLQEAGLVDLLLIDADHSYEGCKKDIANWYPLMARGGVMLFHDYDKTSPGVIQAVNEFAAKLSLAVEKFQSEGSSIAKIQL